MTGCATTRGPTPPDAAAVAEALRARTEIESVAPLWPDETLGDRIAALGAPIGQPWRVVVTDVPAPEAGLFADRTLHLSRGALVALGGPAALRAFFERAEAAWGTGLRDPETRALRAQPFELDIGANVEETGAEEWFELVDGVVFGEPGRLGSERDGAVFLPAAGVRLRLPDGFAFRSHVGPCLRATSDTGRSFRVAFGADPGSPRVASLFGLENAGECPGVAAPAPPDVPAESPVEAFHAERALLDRLAGLLERAGAGEGEEVGMAEAIRIRNWIGARGRVMRDGEARALVALVSAPPGAVALRMDCEEFRRCEDEFVATLESLRRIGRADAPGPLRVVARAAPGPGGITVRDALGRLPESASDAPEEALLALNRGFLDRVLEPGDRLLLLRREKLP